MADFAIVGNDVQNAIDRAFSAGGGRVVVERHVKAPGMLLLRSNVELFLAPGSVLEAPSELSAYPDFEPALARAEDGFAPEKGRKCFIGADGAENIAITGSGAVEMHGTSFYDTSKLGYRDYFYEKPPEPRPRMLELVGCRGVRLENAHFRIIYPLERDFTIFSREILPEKSNGFGELMLQGRPAADLALAGSDRITPPRQPAGG